MTDQEKIVQKIMADRNPNPAVYKSRQDSARTKKPMTAVTWTKVISLPFNSFGFEKLAEAYRKRKDPITGYVSWDELHQATGMEIGYIASLVRSVWEKDRESVSFSVNRMGDNAFVKIKKPELFKQESLTKHWTES